MNRDRLAAGGCFALLVGTTLLFTSDLGVWVLRLGAGILVIAVPGYFLYEVWMDTRARRRLHARTEQLRRERETARRVDMRPAQLAARQVAEAPYEEVKPQTVDLTWVDAKAEDIPEIRLTPVIPKLTSTRAQKDMAECPVCQTRVRQGEMYVICPGCGTPHHEDCWEYNTGCAVYGCKYGLV